uniref:Steroid receptor RNA activator 1 n=1 Tax=Culex pipiens TaxID=7175 RepID=A0A8D8H7T5_CULPI
MSGENYRSATKSHDPGWNDPPKLSYAATGTPPPTKLNLNKRIAFPLATSAAATTLPPTTADGSSSLPQFIPVATSGQTGPPVGGVGLPPAMVGPPPPAVGTPPKVAQPGSTEAETEFPSNEEMKQLVERTFRDFVGKLDSSTQAGVQRRLDQLNSSWKDLGDALIRKLFRFARALTDGDSTLASSIHRTIIVDHGKLSVQWAPALRQLMLTLGQTKTQQESVAEGIMKPI